MPSARRKSRRRSRLPKGSDPQVWWEDNLRNDRSRRTSEEGFPVKARSVVGPDGEMRARWSPETAERYDPVFKGATVERAVPGGVPGLDSPWFGFPAWIYLDAATLTFPGDGSVVADPAEALLDPDVQKVVRGALQGSPFAGRPSKAKERQEAILEAIRGYVTDVGREPTRGAIAARLGKLTPDNEPTSQFKEDVRGLGGWAVAKKRAGN